MDNLAVNNNLPERVQAEELHRKILLNANMACASFVEACKCLKEMRDTKLYTQLGFEKFEDYTLQALNIKERQAYTYIQTIERLGERFLQSNAEVGITKLSLLTALPPDERERVVEENDLAGMSTEEVKRLVREHDERGEQISLLEDKLKTAEAELKEAQNKPALVAVQEPDKETLDKIRSECNAAAEKQIKAAQKAAEAATTEIKGKIEKYKAQLEEIGKERAEALEKAGALQKKLAVSASPETVKFTFYFDALQKDYSALLDCLQKIKEQDATTAEKFKEAMQKYGEIIKGKLEG